MAKNSTPPTSPTPAPASDKTLRALLFVIAAGLIFAAGRWTADGGRLAQLEENQAQLRGQLAAIRGGAQAAPAGNRPPAAPESTGLKTGIDLSVDGAASLGRPDAPVTLIEFSDFQCPFCGRYVRETLPRIKAEFVDTGKIRYVFRHYPIDSLHPQAPGSARAAVCAQAQGKFWPFHDRLFANQKDHSAGQLSSFAAAVGVDTGAYEACLANAGARTVDADIQAAIGAGAMGTPAFFIGTSAAGRPVRAVSTVYGAKPFDDFKAAIEQASARR